MASRTSSAYKLHEDDEHDEKYNLKPNVQQGDDPLIQQLPVELQQYVKRPEEHQDQLVFVKRSPAYSCIHTSLSVLCCCWSMCRCHLVRQGEIGLSQYGDQPLLYSPGRHAILSPVNSWIGTRDYRAAHINHGPLHIIRVEMGQLAYAVNVETGKPLLLSRGEHIINSMHFVFKKFVNFTDQITNLDQLQVIRIETGNIGYAYRHGNLVILRPGLHLIEPPDRFGDILSTQMQILDLPLQIHETSDYVGLAIKAAVFYRIVEPEKTLVRIKNISQQISETAIATLAGIIRASSLSDLGNRSQPFYHQADDEKKELDADVDGGGYAPRSNGNESNNTPFFQHVHDEFMTQLHDYTKDEWGVVISNIRIESLKINDVTLQKNISNNAIDVSKQHNRYIMLQKQQEIMMVEAATAAAKLQIETNAQTSTVRAKAQAEADAVIIEAKAKKDALEFKGKGEAEYSRQLESTKLGNQLSLMKVQSEALRGLKQVCYIPQMQGILDSRQAFAQNKLIPDMRPNENELLM
eukprot:CAMPEP_0197029204 /NCGR_PEP_ID=MMETSP1384-20130603/8698_1 /TAXON_ID=29189 /ORGANISM="Ammonia sp." /LENGTH=521 /DNA_ID=CAMNT_0042458327 /DNA_START=81 /DNA_END=1646 /DNA_ORIENTATION=+